MSEYVCPECGFNSFYAEVKVWKTMVLGTEFADSPELGILDDVGQDETIVQPAVLHEVTCGQCGIVIASGVSKVELQEKLSLVEEE